MISGYFWGYLANRILAECSDISTLRGEFDGVYRTRTECGGIGWAGLAVPGEALGPVGGVGGGRGLFGRGVKFQIPLSRYNSNKRAMSKVIYLNNETRIDIPSSRVLSAALESDLSSVVVMGYDADGQEYMASSLASGPEVLWLVERLRKRLLE